MAYKSIDKKRKYPYEMRIRFSSLQMQSMELFCDRENKAKPAGPEYTKSNLIREAIDEKLRPMIAEVLGVDEQELV